MLSISCAKNSTEPTKSSAFKPAITFTGQSNTNFKNVCVMNIDGQNITIIEGNDDPNYSPKWIDNENVIFTKVLTVQINNQWFYADELFKVDAYTKSTEQLTDLKKQLIGNFEPNPSGTKVAFFYRIYDDYLVPVEQYLAILDLQNKSVKKIFTFTPRDHSYLLWSPDGEWILFKYSIPERYEMAKIRPDGNDFYNFNLTNIMEFDWSINNQIVYSTNGLGTIHIMSQDGTNDQQIVDFGGGPKFSPDGQKIVFTYNPDQMADKPWSLYVYDLNKSISTKIESDPSLHFFSDLNFSPDGTKIICTTGKQYESNIYSIEIESGKTVLLASGGKLNDSPDVLN